MAISKIHPLAKTINLKASSKKEFFLLHGYTGSSTDFNQLPYYLNKRFNANVKVILLKGHGEIIDNLKNLNYQDFFLQSEKELQKDLKKGRKIILCGISIGGLIALQLSTKYPVRGVISVSTPYRHTLPIKIISVLEPILFKKYWKKDIPEYEKELRKNAFYYQSSILGLKIVKQGKRALNLVLGNVRAPCLFIHVEGDNVFQAKSASIISDRISSKVKESFILSKKISASHNPFYSERCKTIYSKIGDFVDKNRLFGGSKK